MSAIQPTVFVVDDDAAVRDSLALLLETAGLPFETYASAEDFLSALDHASAGCLVLDMRMGGMDGLGLQAELARRGNKLPILFVTAHGDVPTTVQALKSGAMDFLTKPVDGSVLLERIHAALAADLTQRNADAQRLVADGRLVSLTAREREILTLAVAGCTNKDIARQLGISYRTVEVHRAHILIKTGASSLAELIQLVAASSGIEIAAPGRCAAQHDQPGAVDSG